MQEKALNLFETMSVMPDDIIYTLILKACAQLNHDRAQKLGKQVLNEISKHKKITKISGTHRFIRWLVLVISIVLNNCLS